MRLLLDTQLLIWATSAPEKLPRKARAHIESNDSDLTFSVVSIWEVAIKSALRMPNFDLEPEALHIALLASAYRELHITSRHAIGVMALPLFHKDPFDRLLIAQAATEAMTLLTTDRKIARYPGAIVKV